MSESRRIHLRRTGAENGRKANSGQSGGLV
jgi:hypothetical protein